MTQWGYGDVAGLKGLLEAVNASCPDAGPHLFEPQRSVSLAAIPVLAVHNRSYTPMSTSAVSYTGRRKRKPLAFLQMLAMFSSSGIGHRNEGYH